MVNVYIQIVRNMIENPPNIILERISNKQLSFDFHKLFTAKVKAHYPDGTISGVFNADYVVRGDAVAILAYFKRNDEYYVYLRSCLRPPLAFRDYSASGLTEEQNIGNLWEIPAGCVEPEETGINGLKSASSRELMEEIGFDLPPKNFEFLGKRTFSSVGLSSERLYFLAVEVNPETRKEPSLDGHPMEYGGQVLEISLKSALKAIEDGYIIDGKSEIGLNRLARKLPSKDLTLGLDP